MTPSIPADVLEHCSAALKVLAHPLRLRVVELLDARRLTVGELADELDAPQAAVSQHLSKMRAAGLLAVERDGRSAYYRVTNPACLAVLGCIRKHFV
jgi:DNA-binding transcriptional ArsR family regulator